MKLRDFFVISLLLPFLVLAVSCKKENEGENKAKVEYMEFNEEAYLISELEKLNLYKELSILPEEVADTVTIEWSSSDEEVATVSSRGVVKGISVGDATITAKALGKSAQCDIEVKRITIKDFSVSAPAGVIYVGSPTALEVELTPSAANPTNIAWTSSSSYLKVECDLDGQLVVTAERAGSYTITGSYKGIQRTCLITVKDVALTGLSLSQKSLKMMKNETYSLSVNAVPENAIVSTLKWTSLNTEVATVSSTGVVTAVSGGVTKIVVSKGTISDTCEVVVTGDFLMYVSDAFYITAKGLEVVGTIRIGSICKGAVVTVCTLAGEKKKVTVQEVVKGRTILESASASEEVGLLLSDLEKGELNRGCSVFVGDYSPKSTVSGTLYVWDDRSENTIEAGTQYPCFVHENTVDPYVTFSGFSSLAAGKTLSGIVLTASDGVKPIFLSGQKLLVRRNGYTIATFTVK